MDRSVPLWVLLLSILLGALLMMMFGWAVKSTMSGSDRSGYFGQIALTISSFPSLAKSVASDIRVDTLASDELISVPAFGTDLAGFSPVRSLPGAEVGGLMVRAGARHSPGWYIVAGAFNIGGKVTNAALAISPKLEITNVWRLSEDHAGDREHAPEHRKLVHGIDVMRDGSVIVAFDGGTSLQRIDACGNRVWTSWGPYHHAVTLDDREEFLWTLYGKNEVARVAAATGELAYKFSMEDVARANPSIDILSVRQKDNNDFGGNARDLPEEWLDDPLHMNDVEPLPATVARKFPGFDAGDLLISARSLNLVFVVNPDTLKVKWWVNGVTRRQHDPDWGKDGRITVYDNRMNRDFSRILAIIPRTRATSVLYNGKTGSFYSRIRGKHQVTERGTLLFTSPQQGRALEVDRRGQVVLELINRKPGSTHANYAISEVIRRPMAFMALRRPQCASRP